MPPFFRYPCRVGVGVGAGLHAQPQQRHHHGAGGLNIVPGRGLLGLELVMYAVILVPCPHWIGWILAVCMVEVSVAV